MAESRGYCRNLPVHSVVQPCRPASFKWAPMSAGPLINISPGKWKGLTARTIYFGHQSVGDDILVGIRKIKEEDAHVGLRIVSGHSASMESGIIEFKIGKNCNTDSKNAGFLAA